ncbi:N-acetylmannosamine-6-phosphate 2-epimerase [Leucobacter sp. OH2974_COT-288]|nr:N-acetylmannosamine-6-phosphate 2-epimerase [Leucobacter sp. OH2974_COT-288]
MSEAAVATALAARKAELLDSLRGKLIVSCQAYPGEPLRHPETMAQLAYAAQLGGAAAIRCQGLADIAAIKGRVSVPVIGLWKEGDEGVYITPTLRHARACSLAGADVVALDATARPRPDGLSYAETVAALHRDGVLVMADCGSLADAERAVACGSDIISTTLAGYTPDREKTVGPDFELLQQMVERFPDVPVIAEGRVHTPELAAAALSHGAHAVVVGTAITHPTSITGWFAQALSAAGE